MRGGGALSPWGPRLPTHSDLQRESNPTLLSADVRVQRNCLAFKLHRELFLFYTTLLKVNYAIILNILR